ncbi:hypothetical protein ACFLZN_00555 [Nanoarchaeota archaeon]
MCEIMDEHWVEFREGKRVLKREYDCEDCKKHGTVTITTKMTCPKCKSVNLELYCREDGLVIHDCCENEPFGPFYFKDLVMEVGFENPPICPECNSKKIGYHCKDCDAKGEALDIWELNQPKCSCGSKNIKLLGWLFR